MQHLLAAKQQDLYGRFEGRLHVRDEWPSGGEGLPQMMAVAVAETLGATFCWGTISGGWVCVERRGGAGARATPELEGESLATIDGGATGGFATGEGVGHDADDARLSGPLSRSSTSGAASAADSITSPPSPVQAHPSAAKGPDARAGVIAETPGRATGIIAPHTEQRERTPFGGTLDGSTRKTD